MATEYCRHIRPDGTRCRSYAVTGQPRCYWHNNLQQSQLSLIPPPGNHPAYHDDAYVALNSIEVQYYAPRPVDLDFPALEDRSSIQLALSMVLGALARNRLDPARAGRLLYGLQVASSVIRDPISNSHIVRSSSLDVHGQPLAPDEDPEEITEAQLFLEDYEAEQKKEDDDPDYESKYAED